MIVKQKTRIPNKQLKVSKIIMPNDQEMRLKSQRHYSESIDKSLRKEKKKQDSKIGPILLGVFLFVIVGSTLFQILNVTNQSGDDILV